MNRTTINDIWVQRLQAWLTRPRLLFFFSAFLIAQVCLFIYAESKSGMLDRTGKVRGKDFFIFYLASYLVNYGETNRLYDLERFIAVEGTFIEFSETIPHNIWVYPPNLALLLTPLAQLPYDYAVVIWWCFQLLCFLLSGWLLYRVVNPEPAWRVTACLGYAAYYPLLSTFWNGQLAALLLLVFVTGLHLRRNGHLLLAGFVLSLLCLKPQLAVGFVLWLLLRRQWKLILGMCLGGLIQLTLTVCFLGFDVIIAYLQNFQVIGNWHRLHTWSPDHQHALAGTLSNWLPVDYRRWGTIVQLPFDVLAAWFLFNIVRRNVTVKAMEIAAAIIFTLFIIPHLLTYDLTYLLIAVAALLSQIREHPCYLIPVTLVYGFTTLAPLYALSGFSLVPAALLASLYLLSRFAASPSFNQP